MFFEVDDLTIIFVGKLGKNVASIRRQAGARKLAALAGVRTETFDGSLHQSDSLVVAAPVCHGCPTWGSRGN